MILSETIANNIEFGISMSYLLFYRYGCCIPEWFSNFFHITWALGDEACIECTYGFNSHERTWNAES